MFVDCDHTVQEKVEIGTRQDRRCLGYLHVEGKLDRSIPHLPTSAEFGIMGHDPEFCDPEFCGGRQVRYCAINVGPDV